jgi:hypothetical protein
MVNRKSDLFQIKRLSMNGAKNNNEFILRVSGVWFIIKKLKIF